jgi:hypothetical protein
MQGEGTIRSALSPDYKYCRNMWIWAFDQWKTLQQYHAERGSLRYYEELKSGTLPTHGVQPGDLVLLDRDFGTLPDHIMTCASFDGRHLYTIGGNQGTDKLEDEKGVSRSGPFDLLTQPEPNDVTEFEKNPDGTFRLDKKHNKIKGHKPSMKKNERIHGVGRWSIVDYETHVYATSDKIPAKAAEHR